MKHTILIIAVLFVFSAGQAMTLEEAVALGKTRSLAQQKPRIEKLKARGQLDEAWSNALPQIDGSVGYQRAIKKGKIFSPILKLANSRRSNSIRTMPCKPTSR